MAIRLSFSFAGLALIGLAACASLVTLDPVDPSSTSIQSDDGGLGSSDGGAKVVGGSAITTEAGVTIDHDSIDFTSSPCNAPQQTPLTLKNPTAAAVPYSATIKPGGVFSLANADPNGTVSGTVPANGQTTLQVGALAPTYGDFSTDLQLTIAGQAQNINTTLETTGGSLTFDPIVVDFGTVREQTASTPQQVTLHNDGNAAVTIQSFGDANDFQTPVNLTIAPGATTTQLFSMNPGPASATQVDEKATPVIVNGTLCGTPPTLELKGTRVSANVTVSPATVNMGTPTCGDQPPTTKQLVTFSNYSQQGPANFTATLQAGTHFSIDNTGGQIPAATGPNTPGQVTVQLGVLTVPSDAMTLTEPLTITLTEYQGSPQPASPVTLSLTVRGVSVALNPANITLKQFTQADVPIVNTGTDTVCVQYESTDSAQLQVDDGAVLQPNDQTQTVSVAFVPDFSGKDRNNSGSIQISAVKCRGASSLPTICGNGQLPTLNVNYSYGL